MKLRCYDGKVRRFVITKMDEDFDRLQESFCVECGEVFGIHDTHILKPMFLEHTCNLTEIEKKETNEN